MSDEGTVEREITVPVDPERAWELVTEPEHLERWFAERVELDPTPGAPVRVVGDDGGERRGASTSSTTPKHDGSRISVIERELITVDAFSDLLTGPSHRTDLQALAAA